MAWGDGTTTDRTAAELEGSILNDVTKVTLVTDSGTGRTLALTDAGKRIQMTHATGSTVTVPPNSSVAFETGTWIQVVRAGAGTCTIAAGSGVTIRSPGASLTIAQQYGTVVLVKVATNEWYCNGELA